MQAINVDIPLSLRILTPLEIKALVINVVNGNFRKSTMSEIVGNRYKTKRAANAVVKRINTAELDKFRHELAATSKFVDFNSAYTLIVDDHVHTVYIRQ